MKHGSRSVLGAFGLAAALTALAGAAAARPGRDAPPSLHLLEHRIASLHLDEAVRARALAIVDAGRVEERDVRARLRDAHEQLRALLRASTDAEAVLAQADAIGALKTEAHKLYLRALLEVGALLSSDQRDGLVARPDRGRHRDRWLR